MFDLIFSFIILIISIGLLYNYYIDVTGNVDIYDLNKNILNGFTNTRINTLNDEEIREMFRANKVKNIENTVAQQVGEFYYYGSLTDANDLTRIFAQDYIDKQMNFEFTLDDAGTSYELYKSINRPEVDFDSAEIASVNQRTIFGFKNSTDFYGPYVFRIKIWK